MYKQHGYLILAALCFVYAAIAGYDMPVLMQILLFMAGAAVGVFLICLWVCVKAAIDVSREDIDV